jgi:hypothetical protein
MSENPTIREQIDACRAGSADLSLPHVAELARRVEYDPAVAEELRRSQRFDESIGKAMHDLPVPAGLAERILAAREAPGAAAEVSLPPACDNVMKTSGGLGRRIWLAAAGSLSLAVLLTVVVYKLAPAWRRPISQTELAADTATLLSDLPSSGWRTDGLPNQVPIDPAVLAAPRQWQAVHVPRSAGWSGTVTAIDLTGSSTRRAMLFVVRTSSRFAVPRVPMPTVLLPLTGGYEATAWQRPNGKMLYILVVEERGQRLEDFLRKTPEA